MGTLLSHSLASGKEFKDLPQAIVYFVVESDPFHLGRSRYDLSMHFDDPTIWKKLSKEEQENFRNITPRVVLINGAYADVTTSLGILIHDILEPNPAEMLLDEFQEFMTL